jgi:hypothetical protein
MGFIGVTFYFTNARYNQQVQFDITCSVKNSRSSVEISRSAQERTANQ